jgi:epoxyqueuosine reductase QueG
VESSPPLELDCGSCTLCIDACPTGALDEPGVLDSTTCLSYWTQAPAPVPDDYRAELGGQVYGCDICQDVCPWNRGIEKRRAGDPVPGMRPRTYDLPTGSRATGRSFAGASPGSSFRGTIPVISVVMRSSRWETRARLRDVALAEPFLVDDDELLTRAGGVDGGANREASWRPVTHVGGS